MDTSGAGALMVSNGHEDHLSARGSLSHLVPLSAGQRRLWDRRDDPWRPCTIGFELGELFSRECMEIALSALTKKHSLLRSSIEMDGAEPFFLVRSAEEVAVPLAWISVRADEPPDLYISQVCEGLHNQYDDCLWGVHIINSAPGRSIFLAAFHPLIADTVAQELFLNDLALLYWLALRDAVDAGESYAGEYADFVRWQTNMVASIDGERHFSFWQRTSASALQDLDLQMLHARERHRSQSHDVVQFKLPPNLTLSLRKISASTGLTMRQIIASAYLLVLHRYTGQSSFMIGMTMEGRSKRKFQSVIGPFANTVPISIDFSRLDSLDALISNVQCALSAAEAHQQYPAAHMITRMGLADEQGRAPFEKVRVTFHSASTLPYFTRASSVDGGARWAGFSIELLDLPQSHSGCDIELQVREAYDACHCSLVFDSGLFNRELMMNMAEHLQQAVTAVMQQPAQSIGEVSLLTSAERERFAELENTACDFPQEHCAHDLFQRQAANTPDAIAVTCQGAALTYRALDLRSNQLAHYLRSRNVGPNVLVAIHTERSLEMVVAILGVLKAGGAYVPVDTAFPEERKALIVTDAAPALVLTHTDAPPFSHALPVLFLDSDWNREVAHQPDAPVLSGVVPDDLAYVLYTSGSTGAPKGVMYPHRGVSNILWWMRDAYSLTERDVILQKTPYTFDVSVWELLWPLLFGARLVMASKQGHRDIFYLHNIIQQEGVTVINFVPSMLQLFLCGNKPDALRSLRLMLCAGEALKPVLIRRALDYIPHCEIHNLYGPTETQAVTACRCTKDTNMISIGRPIANTRLYILDEHGRRVPFGIPGELYVAGDGLARGYLGRDDLTAERFLPISTAEIADVRMYKTGDRVRYCADGSLEFFGRLDNQIKLRGLRIELGEIEAQLALLQEVKDAVVILRETRLGEQQLVAYLVLNSIDVEDDTKSLIQKLKSDLSHSLPQYMIPGQIIIMDAFPTTANGKVDRKNLP